jgi:hypothetical protein
MFRRLLVRYFTVFILFFAGFTFIIKYFDGFIRSFKLFGQSSELWVPLLTAWIISYLLFRALVNKVLSGEKKKEVMLWLVIPFSMWIPTVLSQRYLQNFLYGMMEVRYPTEVLQYPKEKFFKIDSFDVDQDHFILHKERYLQGRRSKSVSVKNYYIAPLGFDGIIYGNVAYGLVYSESISYGLITKKDYPMEVEKFNQQSHALFLKEDLKNVVFFEKQLQSEVADGFIEGWKKHLWLDSTAVPTILVPHHETLGFYLLKERNLMIFSILIAAGITIVLFYAFKD